MIIAANKMDIPEAMENFNKIKSVYEAKGFKVFPVSAASNDGLDELISASANILRDYPNDIVFEEDFDEYDIYEDISETENQPFTVEKAGERYYVVSGVGVEKMIGYTNIETEKGFAFFQKYLREKGIIEKLEESGINEGDKIGRAHV